MAFDVIAATGCPTGIAHTFMAKEALEKAAAARGLTIKVETHGQVGVENELSPAEIAAAKAVVVAADKDVQAERFAGKPMVSVGVSKALSEEAAGALIDRALAAEGDPEAAARAAKEYGGTIPAGTEKESIGHQIYKHLMNGVSHMLPFVVAGGVLTAISFLFGIYSFDSANEQYNMVAAGLKTIGGISMNLMVPVLSAYIAESIAKRPGLVPGFVGGMIALFGTPCLADTGLLDPSGAGVGAGFLGGIISGFLAGYVVLSLEKLFSGLPENLNGLKAIFLYPLCSVAIVGAVMLVVSIPLADANAALMGWLKSLQHANPILLGIVVGAMCAFDMGGPVNKAAYVTGTALLAADGGTVGEGAAFMAGVSAACIVPPLATTVAVILGKKWYSKEDHDAGLVNFILGCTHITEGAIPFSAANPLYNIPTFMLGSAIAASLTYMLGIHVPAPHGGFLVLPVVDNPFGWVIAILIGAVISGVLLSIWQKRKWSRDHAEAAVPAPVAAAEVAEGYAQGVKDKADARARKLTDGVVGLQDASASAAASSAEAAPTAEGFVKAESVFPAEVLDTRDDALSFISNNAVKLGIADDADTLMAAFLKREAEGTTGMMDGFAIPHAKTDAVKRASVMVVKAPAGIGSWDTMDQQPVTTAIALLIPETQAGTAHLKILSKVAEALMDEGFRATVKAESDPAKIAATINERLA